MLNTQIMWKHDQMLMENALTALDEKQNNHLTCHLKMLYVNFFKNLDFFGSQVEAASSPEKLASTHQTSHCHI